MTNIDERSDARERALHLLYEAQSKGISINEVIDAQVVMPDDLVLLLARGAESSSGQADPLIESKSRGWTLKRMPILDLAIMRMALFELLERSDVPTAVVLDEAVDLAKRFSTDDSGRFVNGVLAAIASEVRHG
ncbi:MAG: transcription antitermination factor NusB [Actinobacteria bacterium]|jgi:N utilization substance protein B|nr:transcription antitermination factor NusB [Ilumatobacteraceae bacterium]MDA0299076.1 transcription antitermination factor NusB [Actinomycetota bacterium]MDA2960960.1 transcription antitermination factor NusB [Actinomycetota bacterium]MDA2994597.1 transcription antitermination factor NusB [Actinomycetota bacterium]